MTAASAPALLCTDLDPQALADQLELLWGADRLVAVADPLERSLLQAALPVLPPEGLGPGVVLGSGGSAGARCWCVLTLPQLHASAEATGQWLQQQGLDPGHTVLVNPLPLHHISGLMPLVRARHWRASLRWLPPALMRQPEALAAAEALQLGPGEQGLLSLVPTQLQRLVDHPAGVRWLQGFAVIWVGGAALPPALAQTCRGLGLRLAPCYGSTETASMVCALPPQQFLAGVAGCGPPLAHAELRQEPESGCLQIRASSLAAGLLEAGQLRPLPLRQGWWTSADLGRLTAEGVWLEGRADGAISSGGETVFPQRVEQALTALAAEAALPLEALLLLPQPDPLWGQRLVALVRPSTTASGQAELLLAALQQAALRLPASQRPQRWLACPALEPSAAGKWERARWQRWLDDRTPPPR